MASPSLYNLTWGEYGSSLISAVQLLRCHEELVDVTIAAGGRSFQAHKVVLCAASPFLKDLLKSTSCKHPVVMLAGVQAADLEALLEFVYKGEVSIDPNQLPSLLQAAHCLNIQGLASASPIALTDHSENPVKMEINKIDEVSQESQPHMETYSEEEIPIKRKKRMKRLARSPTSSGSISKWSKLYIQTESNDNVMIPGQQEDSSPPWAQQMNIVNVSSSVDSLPIQTPIIVQNIPLNISSCTTPTPKSKGASDQPGACPLCGAMLRQARNLRRHLITSCKYRMLNGNQQSSSASVVVSSSQLERAPDGQLHQLQTVSDKISQSTLENKPIALTPISCSELIPSSPNLISMQSSSMQ